MELRKTNETTGGNHVQAVTSNDNFIVIVALRGQILCWIDVHIGDYVLVNIPREWVCWCGRVYKWPVHCIRTCVYSGYVSFIICVIVSVYAARLTFEVRRGWFVVFFAQETRLRMKVSVQSTPAIIMFWCIWFQNHIGSSFLDEHDDDVVVLLGLYFTSTPVHSSS